MADETIGEFVARTILLSMGFVAFRTDDDIVLVRKNERVPVGLRGVTPRFQSLVYLAAGLSPSRTSHRPYINATRYFLEREAIPAVSVSWSHVGDDGSVYFPTGDDLGNVLRISPGGVEQRRLAEVRVPAVAGESFVPFRYVEENGGIAEAAQVLRWTSLSEIDRTLLLYWTVCLPILRKVGTVPIVRIEGGSSSGKTRTLDAVSYLVNGRKVSSVPTAAALTSRLSAEMLTLDDNRESQDVSPAFLSTLLQATHLGAKEKRQANSDTGTVVERVCGAFLMNGIEPIHDGRSEIASRMLTLRCDTEYREPDSPTSNERMVVAIRNCRDGFWSEAVRRCARALELDSIAGEVVGAQIEESFRETRIGRLSAYLRMMYLAWVAGLPLERQADFASGLAPDWLEAFRSTSSAAMSSLIREELSVTAISYAFAYAEMEAKVSPGSTVVRALGGKYERDPVDGVAALGEMGARELMRTVRAGAKALNGPRSISNDLRAGQLEQRVLDGQEFLRAAGFEVSVRTTRKGKVRFLFARRPDAPPTPPGSPLSAPGISW